MERLRKNSHCGKRSIHAGNKSFACGRGPRQHSSLARHLITWGGVCHFATSCQDVQSLATEWVFALAVAEMKPAGGSLSRLVSLFEHYPINMFCSYPIEDSCLWIPFLSDGESCFGAPILRPAEFTRMVRQILARDCLLSIPQERHIANGPSSPLSKVRSAKAQLFAKPGR